METQAVKKRWWSWKAKDNSAHGFNFAENERELARNVGYLVEELIIRPARWDGEKFMEAQ